MKHSAFLFLVFYLVMPYYLTIKSIKKDSDLTGPPPIVAALFEFLTSTFRPVDSVEISYIFVHEIGAKAGCKTAPAGA